MLLLALPMLSSSVVGHCKTVLQYNDVGSGGQLGSHLWPGEGLLCMGLENTVSKMATTQRRSSAVS